MSPVRSILRPAWFFPTLTALYFGGGLFVALVLLARGHPVQSLVFGLLLASFALPLHRVSHLALWIVLAGVAGGLFLWLREGLDSARRGFGLSLTLWSLQGARWGPEFSRPGFLDRLWRDGPAHDRRTDPEVGSSA